jgi:hypothetical protein
VELLNEGWVAAALLLLLPLMEVGFSLWEFMPHTITYARV